MFILSYWVFRYDHHKKLSGCFPLHERLSGTSTWIFFLSRGTVSVKGKLRTVSALVSGSMSGQRRAPISVPLIRETKRYEMALKVCCFEASV